MKKLLIFITLILCLSLVFIACGKNNEENNEEDTSKQNPTEVTDSTDEATTGVDETEASDTDTTAEETTEATETTEGTTVDIEEVLELMSMVDDKMASLEIFEKTEISSSSTDGESSGTSKSITKFDGYYAYMAEYEDDNLVYDMYVIDNLVLYNDEFYTDAVVYLSQSEYQYVLNNLVFEVSEEEDNSYVGLVSCFKTISLNDTGECYELSFANPSNEFLDAVMGEGASLLLTLNSMELTVRINYDYSVDTSIESISMSIMGTEMTTTTTMEYKYDEFDLEDETVDVFDGYKVVDFTDIFGYLNVSYGADIGLDVSLNSFVLDYNNSERLARQVTFLQQYMADYVGKTFTMYGTVYSEDIQPMVEVGGVLFNIEYADGVSALEDGKLACLTGTMSVTTVAVEGTEYPVYYFEITSAEEIAESDIPEGGYLPWTAFVTAHSLNVRSSPDFSSSANNKVGVLSRDTQVKVVGFIPDRYCKIEFYWETEDGQSGEYAYCSLAYLSKLPTYYITLGEDTKPVNPPV